MFGGGITTAIGSHGGTTFSRNKGGAYMKHKVKGVRTNTTQQTLLRTQFSYAAQYYTNTLTEAQRAAWRTFAASTPVTNRLGNTTFLSGQQMFCRLACNRQGDGLTILTTPPITTAVATVSACTITANSGIGGSLYLNATGIGVGASDKVVFYVSPPLNPGRAFVSSQLRRLGTSFLFAVTNDLTTAYLNQFGLTPVAPGQRVIVRSYGLNTSTGIMSAGFQSTTLWT